MLFQAKHSWVTLPCRELSQGLLMEKATALTCLQHYGESNKEGEAPTPALLLPVNMIKKPASPSPIARVPSTVWMAPSPGCPPFHAEMGKPLNAASYEASAAPPWRRFHSQLEEIVSDIQPKFPFVDLQLSSGKVGALMRQAGPLQGKEPSV